MSSHGTPTPGVALDSWLRRLERLEEARHDHEEQLGDVHVPELHKQVAAFEGRIRALEGRAHDHRPGLPTSMVDYLRAPIDSRVRKHLAANTGDVRRALDAWHAADMLARDNPGNADLSTAAREACVQFFRCWDSF